MIANLKAVLGLDSKPYQAGIKNAKAANEGFKANLKSVAGALGLAFSVGAVVNMTRTMGKAFIQWGQDMAFAAQNMGITTSQMLSLNIAAARGGLEIGDMSKMLAILQVELSRAAHGEQTSADKFEQMNLKIKDLARLGPVEMLQAVTKAAFDSGIEVANLGDLFGTKLGPRAIDALKSLAQDGLPEVDEALGHTADKMKQMGDDWAALKQKFGRVGLGIVGGAAAAVSDVGAFGKGFAGGSDKHGLGGLPEFLDRIKGGVEAVKGNTSKEASDILARRRAQKKKQIDEANALLKIIEDTEREAQDKIDKKAADSLAKERGKNDAMRRAQLDGLERMAADHQAALDEIQKQTDAATGEEKRVFIERAQLVKQNYATEVEAFKQAERDKANAKIDASVGSMQAEVERLREQKSSLNANTRGRTLDRGQLAAIGGHSRGERGGYEAESKTLRVAEESKTILNDIKLIVAQIELAQTLRDGGA